MTEYAPYDYAWKTVGWTTQNGVVLVEPDIPTPPVGLRLVRLTGTYFGPSGRAIEAVVTVRPSVDAVFVDNKMVSLLPFTVRAGHGVLPPTYILVPDETMDTVPSAWQYRIRVRAGRSTQELVLDVPYTTDTVVDLYTLFLEQAASHEVDPWIEGGNAFTEVAIAES